MSSLKQRIESRRFVLSVPSPEPLAVRRASGDRRSARVDSPRPGLLRIHGAPFIGHPTGSTARRFFERAFGVPEVESVSIDAERGLAEIRFAPSGGDPTAQVVRLARGISGTSQPAKAVTRPDILGRGCGSRVRLQRYGQTLSGWSVKHEIEGRIRFENPVLPRRRALRQAIEAEFTNAFGIDRSSVHELTGIVLVHFNPRQIRKRQIVGLLDVALEKTEDFSLSPIDYDLPVSTASVALSATRHFFFPILTPVSAALFLYSEIPSSRARTISFSRKSGSAWIFSTRSSSRRVWRPIRFSREPCSA